MQGLKFRWASFYWALLNISQNRGHMVTKQRSYHLPDSIDQVKSRWHLGGQLQRWAWLSLLHLETKHYQRVGVILLISNSSLVFLPSSQSTLTFRWDFLSAQALIYLHIMRDLAPGDWCCSHTEVCKPLFP